MFIEAVRVAACYFGVIIHVHAQDLPAMKEVFIELLSR
jgi:hypothetical protein